MAVLLLIVLIVVIMRMPMALLISMLALIVAAVLVLLLVLAVVNGILRRWKLKVVVKVVRVKIKYGQENKNCFFFHLMIFSLLTPVSFRC